METTAQLQKQFDIARAKLMKVTDADERKKNLALLGKCFKYPKNCYSMPQKPSDYWTVYYKVVAMAVPGYGLKAFMFQTDSNGHIRIEKDEYFHSLDIHVPISQAEFQRAWKRVQTKIAAMKP